jgi:hypothetical protein
VFKNQAPISRISTTTNVGKDAGGWAETLIHCWWECEIVQVLWKTIWRLLKKLNIDRSVIGSSNSTPRDIPKGM